MGRQIAAGLGVIPGFAGLEAHYDAIEREMELVRGATRGTAKRGGAGAAAGAVTRKLERLQEQAGRLFHDMDFRFLLNRERMLMRIRMNAETEKADDSHYDLLASEARTAVFLAVAKGDFPREAWFRLGRRLCSCPGDAGRWFRGAAPCWYPDAGAVPAEFRGEFAQVEFAGRGADSAALCANETGAVGHFRGGV